MKVGYDKAGNRKAPPPKNTTLTREYQQNKPGKKGWFREVDRNRIRVLG